MSLLVALGWAVLELGYVLRWPWLLATGWAVGYVLGWTAS